MALEPEAPKPLLGLARLRLERARVRELVQAQVQGLVQGLVQVQVLVLQLEVEGLRHRQPLSAWNSRRRVCR